MMTLGRWLRLCDLILHLLLGALIVLVSFAFLGAATREKLVRWWAGVLLHLFGLSVVLKGDFSRRDIGHMLLLNHVSWIDVYVVDRYRAARFVAKSEIRSWPLIGWLCERTGTIFIERGRRRAVHGVIEQVTQALTAGSCVAVFPEGTTTDGSVLLPFHSNMVQAAIDAGTPVVPATIRYRDRDGRLALAAAFIGDMTIQQSVIAMLRALPLSVELTILPAIDARGQTRRQIAEQARVVIRDQLGIEEGAREIESSEEAHS
jgi:1-acyl-sn-glycerol-3-phosphate acyltransferase